MENRDYYEILSPVGDMDTFYTAINSGADAVYMGLPRFNARMRAENISLDNLSSLVSFAHLKGVNVYITLNTLLNNNEVKDVTELVGECLKCGVDAFIIQDLALVYVLKKIYPNIVLHGSTQMGVHNVRGAKVAKELGLSRVVLSREVTLKDIEEISQNVDIELEVFIQGAMCVSFSGNCYLSSIKHNASGNRGECKQLCRLPYSMGNKSGYMLSPKDNCMIDYLQDLVKLKVKSFKIEGRLRHKGYVAVATDTYNKKLNDILSNKSTDDMLLKNNLKKVFSRGDFTCGYLDTNDIINTKQNNHLGEYIGKVTNCNKFKDIYKITLNISKPVHSGDGLKFVYNNDVVSLGVGNVDKNGDKYMIYGKNYIQPNASVYLSLDNEFENSVNDNSKLISISMNFIGIQGSKPKLTITAKGKNVDIIGDTICEVPKTKPITESNVIEQLSKVDSKIFKIENIDVVLDDIFIPLSKLNELRRQAIEKLTYELTKVDDYLRNNINLKDMLGSNTDVTYSNLCIVDENMDIRSLKGYDAVILSPTIYSVGVIDKFRGEYKKHFKSPLIINLPIVALSDDLKIIDGIVEAFKGEIFIANNIYALDYISQGVKVFAGTGLNVTNDYTAKVLIDLGVREIISSFEKWCPTLSSTYKLGKGKMVLMTMCHCPMKTLNSGDCANCTYKGDLELIGTNRYIIRRYRIAKCYWELVDSKAFDTTSFHLISDLRGIN